MASKGVNWHDVYLTYMGHCVGTCVYCGYVMDKAGMITNFDICPKCGGKSLENYSKGNKSETTSK